MVYDIDPLNLDRFDNENEAKGKKRGRGEIVDEVRSCGKKMSYAALSRIGVDVDVGPANFGLDLVFSRGFGFWMGEIDPR